MKRIFYLVVFSILFLGPFYGISKNISFKNHSLFVADLLKIEGVQSSFFKEKSKDTLILIKEHLENADQHKNNSLYAVAYEHLWKAMLLANTINATDKLVAIHSELGMLYGIYGQEKEAIEHKKKSLFYAKLSEQPIKKRENGLLKAYYNLAVQYRKAKNYDQALVYLDSCSYTENKNRAIFRENAYVQAEKGNIALQKMELAKAEILLLSSKKLLEHKNKHYLVVVYSFLGDLYIAKKDLEKAIYYYEKSLTSMFDFKSHTDLKSDVFKKISMAYKEQKQLDKAYQYLEASTKIADSLFSMRSQNNSRLFEIKNSYKEAVVEKDKKIRQQENVLVNKKKIQTRLIFGIIIIFCVFFLWIFVSSYKEKLRKLKTEQEKSALKIKHNQEKLAIVLETKSKELTVSALQLIDKDKNIDKLLKALKLSAPKTYGKVKREIVNGNKGLWETFNLRFTEVNSDFYVRLRARHATLTPTEQKHCALMKLKFDSKEMARLLHISISSVHMSRHRIRKKIGLQRNEDLSNYIDTI
ncbi:tetratricopeptide repeat protein [Flavicella sediminum]|uniref:tetratricopeptide repeat protein n=1 Tax=Flavicella sediminum TaxID=2585141 RepID=UPI001121A4A2|nr:sel1 repeat family protein [Flavicella sediminum]